MAEAIVMAGIKAAVTIGSWFGASATTSIVVGAKIWNAAVLFAASAGVNAYISQQRELPNQGRMLELGIAPDLPRRMQVGRRANSGVFVDWFTNGHKNQNLWMVIYLGEGPMGPLREIWADGRSVWQGTLNHGQSVQVTEFNSPDERMRIHYMDGRVGQSANPALSAEFAEVTADYKGTGCAYVIIEATWDPDTVPRPPQMSFITDGAMLYDRRKDSTQGGTGTHRLNDPSTWELSNNPAVALDHYLLGNYWPGMSRPRIGVGLDYADVPYDRFAALANLCEENVSLNLGGTEQRYALNGFFEADQVHADIITEICKAMDSRPADFGGKVSAISHDAKSSILTITDDDLMAEGTEIYDPKRSWGQLVGSASGSYQDPANNYQPAEYPAVEDTVWETEDGGETTRLNFPLPFETSPTRAQRLARLFVNRERRQATLTGTYTPRCIELEEGDWFTRTGARFPGGKVFEVIEPPELNPQTMEVMISAVEVDPADSAWNPATHEQEVDTPTGDTNDSPPAIPVPVVTFQTFDYTFGNYTFSSCRFNHTEWSLGPVDIDIQIDESNGAGAPAGNNRQQDFKIPANQQYVSTTVLLPGKKYVVRVRARAGLRQSAWSAWDEFTAGGNAQYGPVGTNGATIGTDLFLADGTTVATEPVIVTSQGTAAAITGQGWGATAAQDAADNNYVGVGGSAIQDPYFDQWGNANFWASDGTGPLNSVTVNLTNDNVPYLRILGGTFTANSQYRRIRAPYVSGGNHAQFLNVQQGDRIGWSAMCGLQAGTGIIGYIEWRNAAGGWVASNSITKNLGTIGTGTGPRSTFDLVDFYADAPAGAAYAFWAIRAYGNTGQAPDLRVLEPQLSRFAPGQVRMPPFMPGSGATRSADQTAVSTAAAIAGQGGQATANASRGPLASRPASPPEGSWYTDTTNNDLQFYTGGTWYKVADVGGSGTFSATISPSYAYGFRFGAGTCTSNVVTAAGSNGSGNYSYLWSMDPSYGIGFTQSASSATQAFTKTMAAGDEINATAYCNVTDDDTGQVIQVACNVRLVAA